MDAAIPDPDHVGVAGDVAAEPFEDSEALGDAWHAIGAYHAAPPIDEEMEALLRAHPAFASRCVATPSSFFFGPVRELLRWKAVQPRARANLSRFRCKARGFARFLTVLRMQRRYAPGGAGYAEAQADFIAAAQM